MHPPLRLRRLTGADLSFADSVRALAGWNQTRDDWARFLATEPEGCFLAEWNEAPAGTATTTVYGPALGWIGMVLVHPEYRRRGIGRALLMHCLAYLRDRGVRGIKLDATLLGRTVYESLGFQDEWTFTRWEGRAPSRPATHPDTSLRPWRARDASLVAPLDVAAFGISRRRLLKMLNPQSRSALVRELEPGRLDGYGLLRPGAQALYLGPVVATSVEAGIRLVEGLLVGSPGQRTFWDIPDQNASAVRWAQDHGFTTQRVLTRMFRGENLASGNPRLQLALAGPEVG